MSGSFITLDLEKARNELSQLYQRVARESGRVEITDPQGDAQCVLISAAELEGLERALRVLSDTPSVRALHDSIKLLAAACDGEPAGCGTL